jgi:hypothetical protein
MRSLVMSLLVLVACGGSDGGDNAASPDAGGPDADACSLPNAGVGETCAMDTDCTCDTTCSGLRCVAPAACDEAQLSWDGAVSNTDGTCLTDLGGYKLYWSTTSGGPYDNVIDVGEPCNDGPTISCGSSGDMTPQPKCSYRLTDLPNGTVYIVMSTYTTGGLESAQTGEVSKVISCP